MSKFILSLCLSVACLSNAFAHQPSTAYLQIDSSRDTLSGSWDIPLLDLEIALGMDQNRDQNISWGEITRASEQISALVNKQLTLLTDNQACDLEYSPPLANQIHGDGYLHLAWVSSCQAASPLGLSYQMFAEQNGDHRALLKIAAEGDTQSVVVRASDDPQTFRHPGFISYFYEGVIHIWIGYDHLLFLLLLLLPLFAASWRQSITHSLWLISAFTVAHSLSLIIVTLGNFSLPVKLVELGISLSIAAASSLLIWKPNHRSSATLALGLGLLHGLGFANVLRELLANGDDLALHLLGFNLGVEAGQLVIAAAVIPLLILAQQWFNYLLVVRGLALVSFVIALFWTLERL